jgi:hypothetical protein
MGVRRALFPTPTFGAPFTGLPASRRHSPRQAEFTRPHSRAVQRLAASEFRVRPLSSLRLMVAPPAYEPGQDTFVIATPRLDPFALGRPSFLAMRWPNATGLTSYLSGCLSLTSQRFCLAESPTFWKFSQAMPWASWSSRIERSLCHAFQRFSFGGPLMEDRQSRSLRVGAQ